MNGNTPPHFYKYRSLSDENQRNRLRQILLEDRLYFPRADQFNDPFDCAPVPVWESTGDRVKKWADDLFKRRTNYNRKERRRRIAALDDNKLIAFSLHGIFAAIDCDGTAAGTRAETASRTAPATLGTFWPQELPAVSESISSPSSIVARLPDDGFVRVMAEHLPRYVALQSESARAALFRQVETVTQQTLGTSAALSAGIVRPRCGCGKLNDRWKPNVRDPQRNCSECNREAKRKSDAKKRVSDLLRDQELEEAKAELARLKQPAE